MMQKIICLVRVDAAASLARILEMGVCLTHSATDTHLAVMIEPRRYTDRAEIQQLDGVVMLPGVHDPAPIGDLHRHLSHVKAEPHHTMRQVAIKLHDAHGPAFGPDT